MPWTGHVGLAERDCHITTAAVEGRLGAALCNTYSVERSQSSESAHLPPGGCILHILGWMMMTGL